MGIYTPHCKNPAFNFQDHKTNKITRKSFPLGKTISIMLYSLGLTYTAKEHVYDLVHSLVLKGANGLAYGRCSGNWRSSLARL